MRLPSRLWVSLLLPCLCCLVASVLHAQEPNSYLTGKLPNGLSYYACQSKATPGELNFYLFQNVGGIVENDAQNGMAHYLEHMAFNATEHFPQGVMNYLRSQGIYTFNARTRVNETVYQINNIPIENPELVNNAYLILKDWCNGISLTAKDVEKERQIIIEEGRQRGGLSRKISDAIAPFMYNNTKYAFRNVIGNIEVLRKFTHEDIRKFYQQWYRPDLQCVIVIGDQDPQEIEAKIKEQFSALPKPTTPNPREEITIPNRSEPTYFHFSDPENKFTSMCLYRRIPKSQYQTENSGKQTVFERLFNTLASQRLALLSNDNREEFINASVTFTPLVRPNSVGRYAVQRTGKGGTTPNAGVPPTNKKGRLHTARNTRRSTTNVPRGKGPYGAGATGYAQRYLRGIQSALPYGENGEHTHYVLPNAIRTFGVGPPGI